MKKYKYILVLMILVFVVPSIAFASWWNPFTWKIFHRAPQVNTQQSVAIPTPVVSVPVISSLEDTTIVNDQSAEIDELRNQIEKLREEKNQVTDNVKTQTVIEPVVVPEYTPPPIIPAVQTFQQQVETWPDLEIKYFSDASQKDWPNLIITNSLGEKRYYRKEGSLWKQKNTEDEINIPYVEPPTPEELATLKRVCREVPGFNICSDTKGMEGYRTIISFRSAINDLIKHYDAEMANQQLQKQYYAVAAQARQSDCLQEITPPELRTLDPASQSYLRKLQCGTVTDYDRTNYELTRISSSIVDLELRLKNQSTFSPFILNDLQTQAPVVNNIKWQVRWEGEGVGSITTSNGQSWRFHCESSGCQSY